MARSSNAAFAAARSARHQRSCSTPEAGRDGRDSAQACDEADGEEAALIGSAFTAGGTSGASMVIRIGSARTAASSSMCNPKAGSLADRLGRVSVCRLLNSQKEERVEIGG